MYTPQRPLWKSPRRSAPGPQAALASYSFVAGSAYTFRLPLVFFIFAWKELPEVKAKRAVSSTYCLHWALIPALLLVCCVFYQKKTINRTKKYPISLHLPTESTNFTGTSVFPPVLQTRQTTSSTEE